MTTSPTPGNSTTRTLLKLVDQELSDNVEVSTQETLTARDSLDDAGMFSTVLYHERLKIYGAQITIAERNLIYRNEFGAVMVQRLILENEVVYTTAIGAAEIPLIHLDSWILSKRVRSAIKSALGRNSQMKVLFPIIKKFVIPSRNPDHREVCEPEVEGQAALLMPVLHQSRTPQDLITKAFGAHHLSDELVTAVDQCRLHHLLLVLSLWDDTIPIEEAIAALHYLNQASLTLDELVKVEGGANIYLFRGVHPQQATQLDHPGENFFTWRENHYHKVSILKALDSESRRTLLAHEHIQSDLVALYRTAEDYARRPEIDLSTQAIGWEDLARQIDILANY